MTNKRRLPFLAFALVAATHAAPQYEENPIRLSNDFVFRALTKQTKGNAAIAPGGPLAAMAALGVAENPLPELAQKRLGGSADAAGKLLQSLDRAEQGLRQSTVLRHTRSAWLTEPVPVEPSVLAVRPASEGRPWLRAFMATAALPKEEEKASTKPAGLASITAFEAVGMFTALPREQSMKFNDKPVDTLRTSANGYQADEIAETVTIPLTRGETHFLVITLPKDGAKLNELMTEVGSRVELAMGEPYRLAYVTFPRVVTATEIDAAEALGLAAAEVTAESRTFVTIGNKPPIPTKKGGGFGGSGMGGNLPIWRPERFIIPTMPGRPSGKSNGNTPVEIPEVKVDRPFAYAIVEKKTRTVLLAGIVREIESNQKAASGK